MSHFYKTIAGILLLVACTPQSEEAAQEQQAEQHALQLAGDLKKSGHPAGAAEVYRELLAKRNSVEAAIGLAEIYRKQGRGAEAVNILRRADAEEPGDPRVLAQLGYALIAAKEPEEAVNVFDALIAAEPDNAMAYNGKGVAFDSAGNHVAAQELYQKALSLAPGTASIKNNLALSLILDDRPEEAVALLEPVAGTPDATSAMRQNLALAYGLAGDFDRARELNLKDLSPQQAEENLRFYQHYAERRRAHAAAGEKMKFDELFEPDGESAEPVALFKEGDPVGEATPAAGESDEGIVESDAEEASPFGNDAVYDYPGK